MVATKKKTRNATLLRRVRELEDIGADIGNMLAEPESDELHRRAHAAPKRLRTSLVRFQRSCSLAGTMLSDFSRGFGARTKNGTIPGQPEDPLHVQYSLEDGHEAMQLAVRWGAIYLTGEFEHFMRGVSRQSLSINQPDSLELASATTSFAPRPQGARAARTPGSSYSRFSCKVGEESASSVQQEIPAPGAAINSGDGPMEARGVAPEQSPNVGRLVGRERWG